MLRLLQHVYKSMGLHDLLEMLLGEDGEIRSRKSPHSVAVNLCSLIIENRSTATEVPPMI